MSRHRAAAISFPRLYSVPPPAPTSDKRPLDVAKSPPPSRIASWVHVRGGEIVVQVQGADALELVDRALITGLLQAGLGAEKEGVRMTAAVEPPICFGKVRVYSQGDDDLARVHLDAARAAIASVLHAGGCEILR